MFPYLLARFADKAHRYIPSKRQVQITLYWSIFVRCSVY